MKQPYCLVSRPICTGGMPVNCWQLLEEGEALLNKRGEKVIVYKVDSIIDEVIWLTDIKTCEQFKLTSEHDCRNFNVYWKSNEDFEGIKS